MKKEKQPLYSGIIIGIAIISTLGFATMGVAYLNNRNTASPVDDSAVANTSNTRQPIPTPTTDKVDIEVTATDHIRGNVNAPVTIIEYSDYQCPYCSNFHKTMQTVMENYPDQVRWVYRHFPLDSIHPYARKAATAAECAGAQDKYWEYTDELFANQSSYSDSFFSELAEDLNLNLNQFDDCIASNPYNDKIQSDFNSGRQYGITGTPGSFINGQLVKGALPFSSIQSMIDSELN